MKIRRVLFFWVPLVFVVTILCLFVDIAVQQNYRLSANDPQVQIAQDYAQTLRNGGDPKRLTGTEIVDIRSSLAPFVIIYDTNGTVVSSSARLNNTIPTLPQGVLQNAKLLGENRLTWQPASGVREAIVVVAYTHGYVLVGRSLKETETRENYLTIDTIIAWITCVVGSLFLAIFLSWKSGKK